MFYCVGLGGIRVTLYFAICFEKYLLKIALFVADNQRVGYFCGNSNTKILKYGNRSVNVRGRR